MRKMYLEFIVEYGVLLASISSLIFFLWLFVRPKQKASKTATFIVLVLTSLVSLEFYPYQIASFPLNSIIPIGIIVLVFIERSKKDYPKLIASMAMLFSLYLILGLVLLSASANTWGSGPVVNGIFMVCNAIALLITLFSIQKKADTLFVIAYLLVAIGGFTALYFSTNGFSFGEYDGQEVRLWRISSVVVCVVSFANAVSILAQHKRRCQEHEGL